MADVQLIFGIDPTSRSTIESGLNNILSGMHPKVKVNIDTGDVRAAYSEYRRLNGVIESTYKEINKLNSGANPNKDVYSSQLQTQLQRLESLKAALNKGSVFEGTVITGKNFGNLLDEILAKISDIKVAFSTVENGNYMTTLGNSAGQYEQALGKVEEKIRTVSSLQTELNDGTKVADAGTTQKINELGTAFEKLAQDMHGMPAEQFREQFAKLSNELARLQSQVKTPVKLLGDDPTRLANTMGEVQRMMNNVANLQEKLALGKGVAKSGTATELNNMRSALQQFSVEMKNMPADEASQKVAQFRAKIIELTGAVRANSSIFANFFGGFGAGIKSYLAMTFSWYRIIGTTIQELKQMVGTAVDLNSAFTQLQIVTRVSDSEMSSFSQTLADTAKNMSASVKDMTEVATVYARLGYSLEESNVLAQYTAMLQNVGDIDSGAASDALTAIVKAYGKGVDDIESLMDKMVEVGNNFPISVSQIAEGMNNAASMMANAGMSFDESVAMLTAANTTVQNISKSSTGLRTIIARLRNVKSELDDAGEVWNEAKYQELISALTKGGVDLQDATGALRNPYEVLKELADRWSSLTSDVKAAITTALAGTRQQDIFASLMNQFGEATKAMEAMGDSAGALTDAYDIFEDSMQGHINTLKAAFEELSMTAIDKGLVNSFVDMGTTIVEGITPIVSGLGKILSFLGPIKSVLGAIIGFKIASNIKSIVSGFKEFYSVPWFIRPNLAESMALGFGKSAEEAAAFGSSVAAIAPYAAIAGAAIAGLALYVRDLTSAQRTYSSMMEHASNYSRALSEVDQLNSELDGTRQRIDELNAKDSLSLVEQQELDNLVAQNRLLQTQLEIKERIAEFESRAAAKDASTFLSDNDYGRGRHAWGLWGEWSSEYGNAVNYFNTLDKENGAVAYFESIQDAINSAEESSERWLTAMHNAEVGTYQYNTAERNYLGTQDAIRLLEKERLEVMTELENTRESFVNQATGKVIPGYENEYNALTDLLVSMDEVAEAQKRIDGLLSAPTLKEYADQAKSAFSEAGRAMTESEFEKAFPELARQAEANGIRVIDVINTIASALGLLDFDEVRKQLQSLKPQNIGISAQDWFDYLGGLDNTKLKKLYEAMQSGVDWSTWDWPDFEAFFDDTEEAVESITTLSEAYEKFDEITSKIDKLTEAHEKLVDGSLELTDVIDLIEEFPDLAEYVDLTAENFGNLDDGLLAVAADAPTALVDELRQFADTLDPLDANRTLILSIADALASMPESSIESLSSQYGELADEVSAAKRAVDELNSSLSEDTNTGYTTRAKAVEEMMDLMEHGAIGTGSKLWSIAESFGLTEIPGLIDFSNGVEAAADQLYELIEARQRWYDGATEDGYSDTGIQNFIDDVISMRDEYSETGAVFEWVGDQLRVSIPNGEFENFAHSIGMSTDELVDMLIQLSQFTDFDWTDVVPEEFIPDQEVQITADRSQYDDATADIESEQISGKVALSVDDKPADMAMQAWRAEQSQKGATVPVDTDNSGVEEGVAEAEATVSNAVTEPMAINVDASAAIEKVVNTQRLINSMHGKTVAVSVKVNGLSNLQNLINKIAQVKNKSVTITSYTQQLNKSSSSSGKVNGTAHAGGNWGTRRTERALTGELGPEIVVDPSSGRWYTVGDHGAEFVRIPKGAIVFNHKQTEALLKNGHAIGRGSALAEGTAYLSASGSFKKYTFTGRSSSSSSSSGSSSSNSGGYSSSSSSSYSRSSSSSGKTETENWFERLYEYHNHLVNMCQEEMQDYLTWLDGAYRKAYNEGILTIEEWYKYQEEVFSGLQELFEDYLDDIEHEITMREHFKGETNKIISLYEEMIAAIEKEIAAARKAGLDDTDEYIQGLQERWFKYYDAIADKRAEAEDNAKESTDVLIDYRIKMLKQEAKDEQASLKDRLKNLKDFYQKQKELLQGAYDDEKYLKEQEEKRRSVTDVQMELERLSLDNSAWAQKRRLELSEELAKAQEDLDEFEKDHALDVAKEQLDEMYELQEKSINDRIDLIDENIDSAKYLYDRALSDIRNGSVELYEEMIAYNDRYGDGISDTIKTAWEDAYVALKDYYDLNKEMYRDINLANATGYEESSGSWDTSVISGTNPENIPSASSTASTSSKRSSSSSTSSTKSYPYGKASSTSGNIGQGSTGNSVRAIQWALNQMGSGNSGTKSLDGVYGAMTATAVKAFQRWMNNNKGYNLAVDGIVGSGTRKAFAAMGYALGTTHATPGMHRIDERGSELVFESANGNRYRLFSGGEKVLNASATNFLYQFATSGGRILTDMIRGTVNRGDFDRISNSRSIGDIVMGDIIINGNADQRTVSQIRREQREGIDYVLTQFARLNK